MLGAWRCGGDSNEALVENLWDSGIITHENVRAAMLNTDRGVYAPARHYDDTPQPLGLGQTISAPHMHATAAELLAPAIPHEGARVLDVGCGSGYLTAVLARLAGPSGKVWGIDCLPQLVHLSEANVRRDDARLLDEGRVTLHARSGWDGLPEAAPFDAIHVGAAAASIPPKLAEQLKVGGRMVIPVGPHGGPQELLQVDRTAEGFTTKPLMGVVYVPLVQDE
ncbi:l-isoaspartyl protein carboxyl methyltransferase, like [Tribonema minus]|uniref:protein-L-isoaspartate(D-aspartate) O-methyltransferase n=1 Tax=Tribonema minus TaxID=303371 RepID=A0A835Z1I0_9STRA|nr:l-isoaspartyl protein carboxyl methyltransferase, like [Tribonema minus]